MQAEASPHHAMYGHAHDRVGQTLLDAAGEAQQQPTRRLRDDWPFVGVQAPRGLGNAVCCAFHCGAVEPLPLRGKALVVLIREFLGGTKTELIQQHLPETRLPKQFAAQIIAQVPKIGVRKLAKMLGLSPSTITRWKQEKSFNDELYLWTSIFNRRRNTVDKTSKKAPKKVKNPKRAEKKGKKKSTN
jgi:hypothetical protein